MKKKAPQPVSKTKQITPIADEASIQLSPDAIWALVLFAFSVLLYVNTVGNLYALDDVAVIEKNRFVQQGFAGIPSILSTFYWQGFWDLNTGLYRPLSLIMFAIEWQLFPGKPFIGHLVNVLLFAGAVVLLFKLLQRLFANASSLLPVIATILFAAHPIHTEVVANIKSRDELLAMFMLMAGSIYLLKYLESKRVLDISISVAAYFLALLSKESSIAFIAIFGLLIYYKEQLNLKRLAITLAPFAVIAVLFFALHQWVVTSGPAHVGYTYRDNTLLSTDSFAERIATSIMIMGKYLWLMLWPRQLSYDYSFHQIPVVGFADWRVWLSIAAYAILIGLGIQGLRKKNALGFGIAFFVITILITSNLFFVIGATMGERFLFIPSAGLCIAAAYGIISYLSRNEKSPLQAPIQTIRAHVLLFTIVLSIATVYSFKTITRNVDWRDSVALFLKDIEAAPNSYNVQYNYGTAMLLHIYEQETDSARKAQALGLSMEALQKAVSIDTLGTAAYINLSSALFKAKRYKEAMANIRTAMRLEPGNISIYPSAGIYAYRANETDSAIAYFNRAISNNFITEDNHRYLGTIYFERRNYELAIENYNKALSINPGNIETIVNAANTYAIIKNYTQAAAYFKRAMAIAPANASLRNSLLQVYNEAGHKDSVAIYQDIFARN